MARVYFGLFGGGHLGRMRGRGSGGFGGGASSLCGGEVLLLFETSSDSFSPPIEVFRVDN